jgi:hypothetical protein
MQASRALIVALIALVALIAAPTSAVAAAPTAAEALAITLSPDAGPPGTVITIAGSGAAPNAEVSYLYGYFGDRNDCQTNQRGQGVAGGTTRANASGRFTFTHIAAAAGNSGSIRFLASSPGALPSPWTCFAFGNDQRTFPETGKTVSGDFLAYWNANGGLAQQGLPLTDLISEVNPSDGKTYQVQYFERARFELHPENQPPYRVLLGLLGSEQFRAKYPGGRAGGNTGDVCFQETGRCVRGRFFAYWQANGGLAQQGLPISDEFDEVSPTDGKIYRVQYFERARFEAHPENAAPYDVLLGLLGREQLQNRPPVATPVDPSWGPSFPPLYGGKTHTDPQDRFSMRVPTDWKQRTSADAPDATIYVRPGNDGAVYVEFGSGPSGTPLEAVRAAYEDSLRQTPGITILRIDKVVIDGVRAYRFVHGFVSEGRQIVNQDIIFISGRTIHLLSFSAYAADIQRLSVTFDGIAGSYRIGAAGR